MAYRLLLKGLVFFAILFLLYGPAESQEPADSLVLNPLSPDSVELERKGKNIVIRWYPAEDSVVNVIGPANFTNWWYGHDESERVEVEFLGHYTGMIDRTLFFTLLSVRFVKS